MGRPAKPSVPNSRPYTGFDAVARGITGGLAQFIIDARRTSDGVLHSLGAFGVREQRGHPGVMSVHSTGRAVDMGYGRKAGYNDGKNGRDAAIWWLRRIIEFNDRLGIEAVLDYFPEPYGAGWFCDRQTWRKYTKPTIGGAPGGLWWHIELSPLHARNAKLVKQGFDAAFPEFPRTHP